MKPHELLALIVERLERDGHDVNKFAFMISEECDCGKGCRHVLVDPNPTDDGGRDVRLKMGCDELTLAQGIEAIARAVFQLVHGQREGERPN
jgi:hypothetical protein